ncbi:hypothetical protein [Formosa sp. PL04]|uniref:hypothetical protein n=1 Tax=Formosa sp. PL04 TaxID=3081755 RepID=UPI002982B585|nr:hypothetical protein [Formosa sp. PL04]MDW5288007.1 hypothetical protein [Formosa sp. PL04]
MKKFILLIVITTFFACDSSDDSQEQVFNPPNWIQGTWDADNADEANVKFTTDNFCTIILNVEACLASAIEGSYGTIRIENEVVTDTDYKFTINRTTGSTNFHYRKKTDSTMVFVLLSNIETVVFNKK